MDVSIEKQAEIARKLTVTIDAATFDKAVQSKLVSYAKHAKLAGFRKGKIPQNILQQQFGKTALKEGVDDLIGEHYPKALQQEKLVPATLLAITPTQAERGKDFIFDVEIEIYPEIEDPDLKGKTVEQIQVSVSDGDIDRTLESIQKRETIFVEKEGAAGKGDQISIDFVGSIKGEVFEGGTGNNAQVVLGEGRFMETFETNLMGAKKGDDKTFKVKFPKDYHGVNVAGKTAEFSVTVNQVSQASAPKIDEAFAQKMGVKGGINAMRAEVKLGLEREMKQKLRSHTRDRVMAALAEKYDFPIPKAPVEEEIDRAVAEVTRQLEQQGMPSKGMIKREVYEAPSKERVKLGLLVRKVIETQKITASKEMLEHRIQEMSASYSEPEQFMKHLLDDPQQRDQVAGVVLEEQVTDHLLTTAKIKNVKKSYEEFMSKE